MSKLKISNFDLIEKQKLARSQKYKEKNARLWTVFRKEIDPKSIPSTSNQNLNRTKSFQEAKTNIETCELKGKDSIGRCQLDKQTFAFGLPFKACLVYLKIYYESIHLST